MNVSFTGRIFLQANHQNAAQLREVNNSLGGLMVSMVRDHNNWKPAEEPLLLLWGKHLLNVRRINGEKLQNLREVDENSASLVNVTNATSIETIEQAHNDGVPVLQLDELLKQASGGISSLLEAIRSLIK